MRAGLAAVIAGLLFGAGLVVSDMVNPARVLAFLDIAGAWDPSLAWVMAAALLPSALAWQWRRRRTQPLCDTTFHVPTRRDLDARLLAGAALFGIGWGLVGLCPGPAWAGLVLVPLQVLPFLGAMLAGMALYRVALDRS